MGFVGRAGQWPTLSATFRLLSLGACIASCHAAEPQPVDQACAVVDDDRWKDDADDIVLYVNEIGRRLEPVGPSLTMTAILVVLIYIFLWQRH